MTRISNNGSCDLLIDFDGEALNYKVIRRGRTDAGKTVQWVSMAGRRTGGRVCDLVAEWSRSTGGRCTSYFRGQLFASPVVRGERNHTLSSVHPSRVEPAQ